MGFIQIKLNNVCCYWWKQMSTQQTAGWTAVKQKLAVNYQ